MIFQSEWLCTRWLRHDIISQVDSNARHRLTTSLLVGRYWTTFARTGNPNSDGTANASAALAAAVTPKQRLALPPQYRPEPTPPHNCSATQPHIIWPKLLPGSQSATFITFQMCNVTVQRIVPNYRAPQCKFCKWTMNGCTKNFM